ncbi:MAG: TlyA family RNA methyltransferase [Sphaerochaetaceae bacterium]
MAKKKPLLDLLVKQFPQYKRDQLSAFVACRNVLVDGVLCSEGRTCFDEQSEISFTFEKYVSRGGYKLEHALLVFDLSVESMVFLDAGSSTGGFTDCLLQKGALCVHSVDVGTNQLSWRLRADKRVVVHEKQNIMTLEKANLDPLPQAAVCDLSFRSITGAASHILSLCGDTYLVSLIKPQFEVPKGLNDFNGVIEDSSLLRKVMLGVYDHLAEERVSVLNLTKSPITGHKGNTEYLALLTKKNGLGKEEFDSLL